MDNEIDKCIIIGNTFAITTQIVVFCVAILSLLTHKIIIENNIFNLNRFNVNKRRKWSVWFMDNMKQGFSTFLCHWWAIFVSVYFGSELDECGMFLIQFFVDSIIGIFFSFLLSYTSVLLIGYISPRFKTKWFTIGLYISNMRYEYYLIWFVQMIHWCVCNLIARIVCTSIIVLGFSGFKKIDDLFSSKWEGNRHSELVFVTLVIPTVINTLVFLLQNWFLKFTDKRTELDILLISRSSDYT